MSRARQPGSVRFAPYFKLQWWEERSLAWRDLQESFDSGPAARAAAPERFAAGTRWRVMEVSMSGRRPIDA